MKVLSVDTKARREFVDITRDVQRCVGESGVQSGAAIVFVPHTTAGVTLNENADPDVKRDILYALERAVPDSGFAHCEGNSDAHAKAALTGSSATVIIEDGRLLLGAWQGIYFCEYDGPRRRSVFVKIIKG